MKNASWCESGITRVLVIERHLLSEGCHLWIQEQNVCKILMRHLSQHSKTFEARDCGIFLSLS